MDALAANVVPSTSLELEATACPLCGGVRLRPIFAASDPLECGQQTFTIVRCEDCGLCCTNPRPTPNSIGQFYPEDYSCYQLETAAQPRSAGQAWSKRYRLHELLPLGQGRLLDFGCGAGDFLLHAQHLGWEVTGLDFSPHMVEQLRTRLGLRALAGTLPHPELTPESFEVITMWQSLEHVHQPLEVLRAAQELLTAGGRLIVAVPNFESLPAQWFGANWHGLELPRHLTHFAPETLRRMLERAGFTVPLLRMVRHNGWLRHSARLANRRPQFSPFWCRWLKHRLLSSWAGWYSEYRQRANCLVAVGVK